MSSINPTSDQLNAFMKAEDDGPISMLNMLRFRRNAQYDDDHPNASKSLSGLEAYGLYGMEVQKHLERVGGKLVYAFNPKVTVIGPDDEKWHAIFIVQYPNAAAFIAMVSDPGYQEISKHRTAALADSRLIRMTETTPGETLGSAG
ncbi:MAG: DUF1330 domain-containing protein [Pseudomonadota bacterium]